MNQKTEEEIYKEYISQKQECPVCGGCMEYAGGLLEWECLDCNAEGSAEYDDVNQEYYIKAAREYTVAEILADPIGNMPESCRHCDAAYPSCVISCSIFDK